MTSKDLLTKRQLFGKKVHSNYEFLEEIKRNHIFNQKMIDYIKATNDHMPTDYQDSHFYNMIKDSFHILRETMECTEIKFYDRVIQARPIPLFGTADFNEFNAFVETEDKASVIVFNEGLLKFVQQVKEIYVVEHWLAARNAMTPYLKKILTQNFIDIMLCYYLFNDAYFAIPLHLCEVDDLEDLWSSDKIYKLTSSFDNLLSNDDYLEFEHQITTSTYLWIAAHEYSHVVLGHLDDCSLTSTLHLNNIDVDVDKIILNQHKEFEADLLGAIIAMESESSPFLSNGIYLALICLLLSGLDKNPSFSDDHPTVKSRIINILNNVFQNKKYIISNYNNIDRIFVPKYKIFKKMLNQINKDNITFSSVKEMQQYVYKIYPFDQKIDI